MNRVKNLTKAEIEEMKRMRLNGATYLKIAIKFNVSESTVKRYTSGLIEVAGAKRGTPKIELTLEEVDEIIYMRQCKLTYKQIAKATNHGAATIFRILTEEGIEKPQIGEAPVYRNSVGDWLLKNWHFKVDRKARPERTKDGYRIVYKGYRGISTYYHPGGLWL